MVKFSEIKIGQCFTVPQEVENLGMAAEIYRKTGGTAARTTRQHKNSVARFPRGQEVTPAD